jgi:hypothetical protein
MQLTTAPAYAVGAAVTPSDTTLVNCRALWVGGVGNLALAATSTSTAVTLTAVPAGTLIPIALDQGRVMSTNTTATLIIALQ